MRDWLCLQPLGEQQRAEKTTVVISTKYRTGHGDDADIEYGYRLSEDGLRRECIPRSVHFVSRTFSLIDLTCGWMGAACRAPVDEERLPEEMKAFKAAAPTVPTPGNISTA